MSIGLFYSTTGGATKRAAEAVALCLGKDNVKVHDIAVVPATRLSEYRRLVFGIPTMGDGELSDEWESWIDAIREKDVKGKTVALFGLGDQEGFPDTFVDALGIVAEWLLECGAEIVGEWPIDGYDYIQSRAEKDGMFAGLVLDEDNQSEKSSGRIISWVSMVRERFL